jgi:hypothetical protein
MRGRAKGNVERIIAQAHQTEAMARQKTLKSLAHYLKPVKKKTPDQSAKQVLAMMKSIKKKQEHGTR